MLPGKDPTDPTRRPASDAAYPVSDNANPGATPPATPPPASPKPADPGWKNSSLDLVAGLEVTDFSETISGEIFDELFKR